jgi:Protein of unknown function (DUF3892)
MAMIRVTAIRLEGGNDHEHIVRLWWNEPATGKEGNDPRATLVGWIENQGVTAYVSQGGHQANVGVVTPTYGPKYLRTYADGYWNDNLLALPRK